MALAGAVRASVHGRRRLTNRSLRAHVAALLDTGQIQAQMSHHCAGYAANGSSVRWSTPTPTS